LELLLIHDPPNVAEESTIELPAHTTPEPLMTSGIGLTVTEPAPRLLTQLPEVTVAVYVCTTGLNVAVGAAYTGEAEIPPV
jgi:hypothetical protein